ncbi:protein kinase domain-containing protein [Citrus sinensis]|uniref:putative leucine-rich repeat receptor-like protein kinase At2g19210 isoform X1 n=2 Tax=Citrus TaxID=2706 RepID=UPI000CED5821|nr:putative leucine-rich repeat receptor-like protein kinase At2g19210 isoform X1 [Citrus sinensis]XP_024036390.1 putative leucine-rich repeat receptor-like protein kinase At2g19210 isoform X1 [Citrus x clementina]KAH9665617.1 protein kinase domain-containing protein [Citrus sinensis]
MGSKCKSSRAYDLMMRFIFISLFAICVCIEKQTVLASDATSSGKSEKFVGHKHARRKLDDIGGDISIDCGVPAGFMYLDEKTQLSYKSDEEFIRTGVNKNISSKFMSANLQNTYATVRSFPEGNRNCYSLRPPEGKAKTYLTRASFMYGDYDDEDKLPEFDLYIGVNRWDSIKFDNASHVVIKEIIHSALMDEINVCLLNTGKGTPFISALELRHFHNATYRTQSGALVLYRRLDVGSTTTQIIRFKDDHYDRIWVPYPGFPGSASINTSFIIDSLVDSQYRLPSAVMKTAVKPMNVNDSLDFDFEIGDPTLQFYVYMHFAELESRQGNQYREFSIELNGNLWEKSVVPEYLQSKTISSTQPARGSKLNFSLCKTSNSTLPPILNAIEIYILTDTLQEPTDQDDVNAIMDIKLSYDVGKGWQGDPCSPMYYSWDGLNCSYNGYKPPKIISLNLTSEGLTGKISPSLSNLKSLENLDLSNNSLTGSIPEFLSQLPLLRVLNLDGNKLSGSVPTSLVARSQNGSLLLSIGRNPDLCLSAPCKKEKRNSVMPVVAASVSLLVILIALLVFWTYKRKRAARLNVDNSHSKKEGSLKSDNQQFTYSEIVDITNNFHRILGKGGFGTVYHGYLADGSEVAIKMLSASSSQGPKQFRTEAQLLMRVHHRNLASLVGYCNDGGNVGLVYEYMAYGNLKQYLFDETKEALSWKDRLQIAVDAAQGLEYLHHGCKPPIIHRDVKTANILLNEKMQAKLADFGFSKIFPAESESHISTSIVGTVGYLDPEYYASNRLTEKSDVYSFGIVLLELITGLPAIIRGYNNTHIVNRVCPFLERGDVRSIVDPRLEANFDTNSVWKVAETAMECVPSISFQRPTMSHVVTELKKCLEMETAREQIQRTKSQMLSLSSSVDISAVEVETEMGPEAR